MKSVTGSRGDARAEWLSNNREVAKIMDSYMAQLGKAFTELNIICVLTGERKKDAELTNTVGPLSL